MPICIALKIKNISQYNLFVNNRGEEIIKIFLNNMIDETYYEGWLKEVIKNDKDDYKEKIIEVYHSMFDDSYGICKLPFFEAISLLGTDILIDEDSSL